MKMNAPVMIDEQLCNGCSRCVFICSMGVIEMVPSKSGGPEKKASVKKPEFCMYCEACVIDCRMGAIKLNPVYGNPNIENISDMLLKKKRKS